MTQSDALSVDELRPLSKVKSLKDLERMYIIRALLTLNWNRTHTAAALGVSIKTLRRKVREYEIFYGVIFPVYKRRYH